MAEVVLRDFDGSETIIEKNTPLPEMIDTEESLDAADLMTMRHYVRTAEIDAEGRPVYSERSS